MFKSIVGFVIFGLTLTITAAARPQVEEIKVNGFTVYLVDVQKGNQLGYVFGVPYGSGDDEPAQMGRAHFFEHMYSRGSTLYPGHETLIEAMTGFGFQRNASTSFSRTSYYGIGLEDHALEAMKMHLAPLQGVELSPSSFKREKATVMNEIITSAPNRPVRSVWGIPFMYGAPEGHASRGQFTGDNETLTRMSPSDLQQLHARIYHAGNVKLAVVGNFTSGKWKRADIIRSLQESLPAEKPGLVPYTPKVGPPAFAKDQLIDIELKSERSGFIYLPVADGADIKDVHALKAMLNGHARHGLRDVGLSERGWITGIGFSDIRIAAQRYLIASFDMTEKGYAQRNQVAEWVMDAVRQTAAADFPAALYEARREEILADAERSDSVDKLVDLYAEWLTNEGYDDMVRLDWAKSIAGITPASVRRGAAAIEMRHRTILFMGPAKTAPAAHDPFFNLRFSLRDWAGAPLRVPPFDPTQVEVPQLQLDAPVTRGRALQARKWERAPGWTFLHDRSPLWTDRTVILKIQPRRPSVRRMAALSALIYTVYNDRLPELEVLSRRGVSLGIEIEDGALQIAATGSKGLEFSAAEWVVHQLNHARLTATDLENYAGYLTLKAAGDENGFPGSIADKLVADLLTPGEFSVQALLQAVRTLDVSSANSLSKAVLRRTDKTMAVGGSYRQEEIYRLISAVSEISPRGFDHVAVMGAGISAPLDYVEPWSDESSRGIGIARVLNGPSPDDLREQIAVRIVVAGLSEQVFLRNRPYGYVQNVARLPYTRDNQYIRFLGQAESPEELDGLQAVWDEEIARWVNGTVTDADIEKNRSSLKAMFSRQAADSSEGAGNMITFLGSTGDPFRFDLLAKLVAQITREEILAAARKYLAAELPRLTVTKGPGAPMDCEALLAARHKVKKRLVR